MSKISHFKKIFEAAERSVVLPSSIEIASNNIDKNIYLMDQTFIPIVVSYANFLGKEITGRRVFNLDFSKDSEFLFFLKINPEEDQKDDDSDDEESTVLKMLLLMESLSQIFPSNSKILGHKNFYEEMLTRWRSELSTIPEGSIVIPEEKMERVIKESLYINLLNIKNMASKPEKAG